jgi:hypothetical protein
MRFNQSTVRLYLAHQGGHAYAAPAGVNGKSQILAIGFRLSDVPIQLGKFLVAAKSAPVIPSSHRT